MGQSTNDFLNDCVDLIKNRKVDPFTNDPDNKSTLNLLGYSVRNMLQEIKELNESFLYKGPIPDDNSKHPGDVWIFKKPINGYVIYIKLKIRVIGNYRELFVMSFHPDRPKGRS